MKILLISPLAYAINPDNLHYQGIERLAYEYAKELKRLDYDVSIVAPADTILPKDIPNLCEVTHTFGLSAEVKAYQGYSYALNYFDVIHDFSHLHLVGRYDIRPVLSIFWHAPQYARYPKAPYNIIALSEWASKEWKRCYGYKALYQQSICIDSNIFKPKDVSRTDRFLTIGRMSPEKGNLEAAIFCKKYGYKLDIVGGRGAEKKDDEPYSEYEKEILKLCDSDNIKYYGDVEESKKLELLQTAKALIYYTNHAEVTSHKTMEAQLCGCPVIVPAIGAMSEVVINNKTGYLCLTEEDYKKAVESIDNINSADCREHGLQWDIKKVISDYIPLYERVANGETWK